LKPPTLFLLSERKQTNANKRETVKKAVVSSPVFLHASYFLHHISFPYLFKRAGDKKMAEKFGYLSGKEYLCKPIIICLWIKG